MSKRKNTVIPIYAFALCWVLCSLLFPIYKLGWLLLTIGLSCFSSYIAYMIVSSNKITGEIEEEEPEEEVSYGPKVDPIVQEGRVALAEMGRLYKSIEKPEIRSRINELMQITDKIIQDAIDDPSDVPQIKQFMNYYLPTTLKLLNSYDRMSSQGISGDNLNKTMDSIEDMLDTAIVAYKKQLDALFADQALDIETDIQVMNQMLEREGLSEKEDFKVQQN